jgi:hypothetical protein
MYMKFSSVFINIIYVLFAFIVARVLFHFLFKSFFGKRRGSCKERFSNLQPGAYPLSSDVPLLYDTFPVRNPAVLISGTNDLKKYSTVVEVGNFAQTTNNAKHLVSPEDGSCTPPSFCGALYEDLPKPSSSDVELLGPVPFKDGARVNFYRNDEYLLQQNNPDNMLY